MLKLTMMMILYNTRKVPTTHDFETRLNAKIVVQLENYSLKSRLVYVLHLQCVVIVDCRHMGLMSIDLHFADVFL